MKNFLFVDFDDGTSDVVFKGFMIGENQCRWPIKNVQLLARQQTDYEVTWKVYACTVRCRSRKISEITVCMNFI